MVSVNMFTKSTSASALRQLKMYMRSTMDEEQLTGLALMNVHSDISLDTEELINVIGFTKADQNVTRTKIQVMS